MVLKNPRSQSEILEATRIALHNVETNPVIKPLMEELGYNTTKIDEGKALLTEAKNQFLQNQQIEDSKLKAYKLFENKRIEIDATYGKDRKKSKIIFKNDTLVLKELGLTGSVPKSYVKWLETISLFYNTLNAQPNLVSQLTVVQITSQSVTEALAAINELESLRASYIQSKGNAQNATKTKNKAFVKLEKYMSNFYAMARITLEDEPQLLESLGKIIKS